MIVFHYEFTMNINVKAKDNLLKFKKINLLCLKRKYYCLLHSKMTTHRARPLTNVIFK